MPIRQGSYYRVIIVWAANGRGDLSPTGLHLSDEKFRRQVLQLALADCVFHQVT